MPPTPRIDPKERRWAVSDIQFDRPVEVQLVDGPRVCLNRIDASTVPANYDHSCPPVSIDPDLRLVFIGEDIYPLEHVMRFRRARAAKSPPKT